jgi:hypothetical protein
MLSKLKYSIYILFSLLGSFFLVYAIIVNPSSMETQKKFIEMNKEIENLLSYGGRVIYERGGQKYGSSYVSRGVERGTMSFEKYKEMIASPIKRGWKKKYWSNNVFCKDGIILGIYVENEKYRGYDINSYVFEYNSSTIKRCEADG